MPYDIVEMSDPNADHSADLDSWEAEGWSLVHIIQGFTTVQDNASGGTDTVYWKPRFVFHKEPEKKPGVVFGM